MSLSASAVFWSCGARTENAWNVGSQRTRENVRLSAAALAEPEIDSIVWDAKAPMTAGGALDEATE